MNNIKEKKVNKPARSVSKKKTPHKKYEVVFEPQLNGTFTINFCDEDAKSAGYAILLRGGLFHRFPEGYVINKTHKELLEAAKIPFNIVKS